MEDTKTNIIDEVQTTYVDLANARKDMAKHREVMQDIEERIILDDQHYETWASARSNEIRKMLMLRWINEDIETAEAYHIARAHYRESRNIMRDRQIKAEKLKVWAAAIAATAAEAEAQYKFGV